MSRARDTMENILIIDVNHEAGKKSLFPNITIFLIVASTFLACSRGRIAEVRVKDEFFRVEVAATDIARAKGLSGRKKLAVDEGMLFVFDGEAERPMWMKNTLIPLDVIWLDAEGRVLFIVENAKPWPTGNPPNGNAEVTVMEPPVKAKYVLEITGGRIAEMKLQIGDTVEIFL